MALRRRQPHAPQPAPSTALTNVEVQAPRQTCAARATRGDGLRQRELAQAHPDFRPRPASDVQAATRSYIYGQAGERLQAFPPTACPPAFPPAPTPPPPTHNAHSTAALPPLSPSCAPSGGPPLLQPPLGCQHAHRPAAPGWRQASPVAPPGTHPRPGPGPGPGPEPGPQAGGGDGAYACIRCKWHSAAALPQAQRLRHAPCREGAPRAHEHRPHQARASRGRHVHGRAVRTSYPSHPRRPVPPSPPSHLHLLPFPPSFLSTRHTHKVGHIFTPTPS
jgi:hypothetical protein